MSLSLLLLIYIGGFVGAVARDRIIQWMQNLKNRFAGTVFVNSTGSFLLGVFSHLMDSSCSIWGVVISTGIIGSYTTFSTYSHDAYSLWKGRKSVFWMYAAGTIILSVAFFGVGRFIASSL
ncbi:fluoride efflux transporter FluC [Bacillus litorisediminis]|uniref:fluoride efflux transporter FluC n=1 Tax=Bacillus litorisediminis TaxID=2922713 RepID=UPI001FAEC4D4|nr:CrcB family protein [Bacillus litorisediminis]